MIFAERAWVLTAKKALRDGQAYAHVSVLRMIR